MYIGKLAKIVGCSPKAIRLYEEMGLFTPPTRQGRYRIYTQHHVDIIRLIRGAQAVGFKLAELSEVLKIKQNQQRFPLEVAIEGIKTKRQQIQDQITHLHALDEMLEGLRHELCRVFAEPAQQTCNTD